MPFLEGDYDAVSIHICRIGWRTAMNDPLGFCWRQLGRYSWDDLESGVGYRFIVGDELESVKLIETNVDAAQHCGGISVWRGRGREEPLQLRSYLSADERQQRVGHGLSDDVSAAIHSSATLHLLPALCVCFYRSVVIR